MKQTRDRPASRWIVGERHRGWRLDRFLHEMIPKVSRAKVQRAIRDRVTLSWHAKPRASLPVAPGGEVVVWFPEVVEPAPTARPGVLYEDAAMLVADKPSGLLVHPTHSCLRNNLVHLLRAERPGEALSLAHRLDRETSGVIVLSKTAAAGRSLARQFERREVEKTYLAVVHGRPTPAAGRIDAPLGVARRLQVVFKRSTEEGNRAQAAVTDYEVLASGEEASLVRLAPRTGRRHQLRAHLAALGHPILGDKLYGLSDRDFLWHLRGRLSEDETRARLLAQRQLLHAWRLSLDHPEDGRRLTFEAPLPPDMAAFLEARGLLLPGGL